jgi:hypothetical protein
VCTSCKLTVYDVDEWQADLDTTEELFVNAVWFFENAKDNNQNLFLEARDILGLALDHMEANGFLPSPGVDPTFEADMKHFIYLNWKSIYDDEYGDT